MNLATRLLSEASGLFVPSRRMTSMKVMFPEDSDSGSGSGSDSDSSDSSGSPAIADKGKTKRRNRPEDGGHRLFSDWTSFPPRKDLEKTTSSHGDVVIEMTAMKKGGTRRGKQVELGGVLDPGRNFSKDLYIDFDPAKDKILADPRARCLDLATGKTEKLLKQVELSASIEKLDRLPPILSHRAQKKERKAEREKTAGVNWFSLPATETTEERKRDLEVLKLRDVLDPKRRYKKDDRKTLPKYYQVGTVVEHAADFYHARVPKKQRKRTIVEELLADAEFKSRSKKKYQEILETRRIRRKGGFTHRKKQASAKIKTK